MQISFLYLLFHLSSRIDIFFFSSFYSVSCFSLALYFDLSFFYFIIYRFFKLFFYVDISETTSINSFRTRLKTFYSKSAY